MAGSESCTRVLKYHHVGIAVMDIPASIQFYAKLGFVRTKDGVSSSMNTILRNDTGMEIHLLQADEALKMDATTKIQCNILMDTPDVKYCGHTHASFAVPSVPAAKVY